MWNCPNCGEQHHDQFKECWKCVGVEMGQQATEPTSPTMPERKLRSLGSILIRAVIGFGAGTLFGIAVGHRSGVPLAEATSAGLVLGLLHGSIVGIFVWVFFPFDPNTDSQLQVRSNEYNELKADSKGRDHGDPHDAGDV